MDPMAKMIKKTPLDVCLSSLKPIKLYSLHHTPNNLLSSKAPKIRIWKKKPFYCVAFASNKCSAEHFYFFQGSFSPLFHFTIKLIEKQFHYDKINFKLILNFEAFFCEKNMAANSRQRYQTNKILLKI